MKTSLAKFAETRSHAEIAQLLGVTRAAISQMLESNREIYIERDGAGNCSAWEKRPIPARRPQGSAQTNPKPL